MEEENPDDIKLGIQLFDNVSKKFKKEKSLKIEDSYICLDKNNKNKIINCENQSEIEDNKFLFCPSFDEEFNIIIDNLISDNNIYQNEEIIKELDDKLWYIIPNNKEEKNKNYYYLSEGDIIKFGNSKFLVNKIEIENNNDINEIEPKSFINNIITKVKNCKFCNSYYFQICECDKTSHFSCFQKINNDKLKIEKNTNNTVTKYTLENYFCKKCKCHYSIYYIINIKIPDDINIPLNSFDFEYPNDDFLILESLGNRNKTIYAINLNEGEIKIGNIKNKENDIGIDDNSISDQYAIIKKEERTGKIKIENLSKDEFNLSILVKKEFSLINDEIYFFKVGKNIFKLNAIYYADSDDNEQNEDN